MRWSVGLLGVVLVAGAPDAGGPVEARRLDSQDSGTTFGMDPEEIRAVVRSHHAELRRCYEQALVQTPRITGKTTIRWVIGETGEVRSVERIHSTHGAPGLDGCIVEAIGSWRFPAPPFGGTAVVTYPFVFRAGTPDAGLPGTWDGGR